MGRYCPLLWRDLKARWCVDVGGVDASPWGLGCCGTTWTEEEVAAVGRYHERWRFNRDHRLPARQRAAAAAHVAVSGGVDCDDFLAVAAAARAAEGAPDQSSFFGPPLERDLASFPEVPLRLLQDSHWNVTGKRQMGSS